MPRRTPKFIWQKLSTAEWLERHALEMQCLTGGKHVVVDFPKAARLRIEFFCATRALAQQLKKEFGGAIRQLPNDWQTQWFTVQQTKPLRIGRRLIVRNADGGDDGTPALVIPASAAFGTGEHATTAMSLRLLELETRRLTNGWRMLDAGTGSGILALAARRFGAGGVVAIDHDPLAIRVAKENARANGIRGVKFIVADVKRAMRGRFQIIAANLYAEVLRELLPAFRAHLRAEGALILSGVLRSQEPGLVRELRHHGFAIKELRRRGKWIALVAQCH